MKISIWAGCITLSQVSVEKNESDNFKAFIRSEGYVVGTINFKEYKLEYVKMEDDEDWKMYRLIKKD